MQIRIKKGDISKQGSRRFSCKRCEENRQQKTPQEHGDDGDTGRRSCARVSKRKLTCNAGGAEKHLEKIGRSIHLKKAG